MHQNIRRILFYGLIIIFFVFGTAIVFYSQGYRVNFTDLAIQKVGGIFVRSYPAEANVRINGVAVQNQSWLLQKGTLINNLLPGEYELAVDAAGYRSWAKTVEVLPSLVSEEDSVVLPPDTEPLSLYRNISDAWFLGDDFALKDPKGVVRFNGKAITGSEYVATAGDKRFFITKNIATGVYYLTDLAGETSVLNINLLFKNLRARELGLAGTVPILGVFFDPGDVNTLYLKTQGGFYRMDLKNLTLKLLDRSEIDYFVLTSQKFIWQDDEGNITLFDPSSGASSTVATGTPAIATAKNYHNRNVEKIGILEKGGALWILTGASTTRISQNVTQFDFSPDGKKIAYLTSDGTLHTDRLICDEPSIKCHDMAFKLPESVDIESFIWHRGSDYLIVLFKNGSLYFTESDDRPPLNAYRIAQNVKKYYYSSDKDTLYFVQDNTVTSFVITE